MPHTPTPAVEAGRTSRPTATATATVPATGSPRTGYAGGRVKPLWQALLPPLQADPALSGVRP
ncbi:hypothetical protein [Streptomyces sp. NBC_01451]|uniref:hypothetical protein n=1 Tax=Streptomyces sp. NBC_01451 TaxID=2903872 RepID=UPI002E34E065|nr:hypothetical protein [Streptomyces sp. NBC_01451]